MKIFKLIWITVACIWIAPLVSVMYLGLIVYACYEEIRYKNPEGSLFNFEWHKIGK